MQGMLVFWTSECIYERYWIDVTNVLHQKYLENPPWCRSPWGLVLLHPPNKDGFNYLFKMIDNFEYPKLLGQARAGLGLGCSFFRGFGLVWVWGYTCDNVWGRGAEATLLLPPPQSSSSCSCFCQPSPPDAPQGRHPPPLMTDSCLFSDLLLCQQSFLTERGSLCVNLIWGYFWEFHIDNTSASTLGICHRPTGIAHSARTLANQNSWKMVAKISQHSPFQLSVDWIQLAS